MEFYEVVIIGAGPAGLRCAEILGRGGRSVLLVEKNERIGPKVCAGGLSNQALKYLNLPSDLLDCRYDRIWLSVNKRRSLIKHDRDFIYTVSRKKLGAWQAEKLSEFPSVKVETETFVSEVGPDYLLVGERKIGFKFLVGADGSNSIVRRYLGIKSEKIGPAIQYILSDYESRKKYKDFELFFDSGLFAAWYAWIFPHADYISIGCGAGANVLSGRNLMKNFQTWLTGRGINISAAKFEAFTINGDYQGHRFGNIFLAGDAAGFASAFTGEGIYQALVSGEEVAKAILDPAYESLEIKKLLAVKKTHDRILHLLIKVGRGRTILFHLGRLLFQTPYFRKKAINILG